MKEVNLTLTEEEANIILNALGNQPYVQVAKVIQSIMQQAQPQPDLKAVENE